MPEYQHPSISIEHKAGGVKIVGFEKITIDLGDSVLEIFGEGEMWMQGQQYDYPGIRAYLAGIRPKHIIELRLVAREVQWVQRHAESGTPEAAIEDQKSLPQLPNSPG